MDTIQHFKGKYCVTTTEIKPYAKPYLSVKQRDRKQHLLVWRSPDWENHHFASTVPYWRTYTGIEVDVIIGDARVAIEIKSAEEIQNKHLKNLKIFVEEHPQSRLIVVSLDVFTRRIGNIECLYVMDFFQKLWSEGL